ncbi:hypothetical protein [Pedobacter rhizosphaerae]|uniref:GLPGLI family protein n=1 Tax=Pedobacter rhizosphaerae TaxID=390241 RepID=A0A1H9P7J1_9SPHI|nr:hypothetical protein [Pedobacter rhizosphaerae]SER44051.1 hypothetical protein SAMN04488023_10962 [Pedobacter rhizosphaerae]
MKRFSLLLVCSFACLFAQAQLFTTPFFKGAYYDLQGIKHTGLLYFTPISATLRFKEKEEDKVQKIDIALLQSIVVNGSKDSLVVLSYEGKVERKYLGKLIATSPVRKFFCKYEPVGGGSPMMSIGATANPGARGSSPSFSNTYTWSSRNYYGLKTVYMYEEGNSTYELKRGNYVEILSRDLSDKPELVKLIADKKLRYGDLGSIFERYMGVAEPQTGKK